MDKSINFTFPAEKAALIYKKHWQIKLLSKQLWQNFPLKNFLWDNKNTIEIQIWAARLAYLLITLVRSRVKCKRALSNLVFLVRQQLMNYAVISRLMEDTQGTWRSVSCKVTEFRVYRTTM